MVPPEQLAGVEAGNDENLSLAANLNLNLSIKSPRMDYYVLTEDRLENLQGGAESLDLTYAGLAFGVFLTDIGIAIPLYISGTTGRIFTVLCAVAPFFLFASLYLGNRGKKTRDRVKQKFEKLKTESKSVATLIAK